ncbi:MAG: hypothetical protein AB8V10_06880 [Francisella endosymbiont of Hyalomma asiaticum]
MQIILKGQFDKVLVDGNKLPNWDYNSEAIVKGDSKVIKISVASILAKLHRDRICLSMIDYIQSMALLNIRAIRTKEHLENIEKYSILNIHRKSYKSMPPLL